jgi:uncharacterized BrkB/YihY/UPF0761 family membrane protein
MNASFDLTVILIAKLALVVAFIYFLRKWFKKKNEKVIMIIYWVLGFLFTFLIPFTIFEWLFGSILNRTNEPRSEYISSLSALLALAFYIIIGLKFFSRRSK